MLGGKLDDTEEFEHALTVHPDLGTLKSAGRTLASCCRIHGIIRQLRFPEQRSRGLRSTYTFTPANAVITVNAIDGRVSVTVEPGAYWSGDFQAMNGLGQPTAGYYPDLRRYPFHNPARGGLNWSGDGRGCNTLNGWCAIDQITIESGAVTGLDLRFAQHCEGTSSALYGVIPWVG